MEVKRGTTFIEGIDVIIRRDLDKHKSLLDKNNLDIQSFQQARSGEIGRKRFYTDQKGKKKYDDDAMDKAIEQMSRNINHLSGRISVTRQLKEQNTLIVDTLSEQLKQYNIDLSNIKRQ